jgi:hypothetical protein
MPRAHLSMLRLSLCTLLLCTLAGCATAELVERNDGPPRSGRAQYLNQGADGIIAQRRRDADRKITEYCAGGYSTDGETEGGLSGVQSYIDIRFTCDGQ